MGFWVSCANDACQKGSLATNIVDLLTRFIPAHSQSRLFVCPSCQQATAFVEKRFDTQEGEEWAPYLRGAIRLAEDPAATYQPFVFLVSYHPAGSISDCWFSYYKDRRKEGGRLKMGYGPGGPPVLSHMQIVHLLRELIRLRYLGTAEIKEISV